MTASDEQLAISDKDAARLARISLRQLRYWEKTKLVEPSTRRGISPRNVVRLYDFQRIIELLVAAELRNRPGITLQHIRKVVAHLRTRGFKAPLREVKFATCGSDIYVQYPDGSWSGDPHPDQVVFHQVIDLNLLGARLDRELERTSDTYGHVVRRRGVKGSKPIFAGTRIPVATVQRYLAAGYDTAAILQEYPSLTKADVQTARSLADAS